MSEQVEFKFGRFSVPQPQIFHESNACKAITNLRPQQPGHVLCVSARSEAKFTNLSTEEVTDLFLSVQKVAQAVSSHKKGTNAITIALQDGPDAGQTVPHIHVHVIPRIYEQPQGGKTNDQIIHSTEYHFGDMLLGTPTTSFLYQNTRVVSFPCITPALPGHALIVTRRCVARFMDLTTEEVVDLWIAAQEVGRIVLATTIGTTAVNYCIQDGPGAGQVCEHVHLHVIPRKPGDLAEDEIYEKLEISEMLLGTTGQGEGCGFSEGHISTALVVDPIALAASADKVKEGSSCCVVVDMTVIRSESYISLSYILFRHDLNSYIYTHPYLTSFP